MSSALARAATLLPSIAGDTTRRILRAADNSQQLSSLCWISSPRKVASKAVLTRALPKFTKLNSRQVRVMAAAESSVAQAEAGGTDDSSADDEVVAFWERIQAHQKEAAKLPPVEEARTLLSRCTRGMLSTLSKKYDGFPFGSMLGYAADEEGRPIIAISTLSPHTADLQENPKCSLLVSQDPREQSEPLVTLVGNAVWVPEGEVAGVRAAFLKKHPDAFWPVKVRFTANIATFAIGASVAEFTGEEFRASAADPIAEVEVPVAVPSAKILNIDRFGMRVEVVLEKQPSRIRLPFPRPAQDRKDVKTLIVEMTQAAKAGSTES
eukprot:jgi/Mesen1/3997/ME000211S03180